MFSQPIIDAKNLLENSCLKNPMHQFSKYISPLLQVDCFYFYMISFWKLIQSFSESIYFQIKLKEKILS